MNRTWTRLNRLRGILVKKALAGTITPQEVKQLDILHAYADEHMERMRLQHQLEHGALQKFLQDEMSVCIDIGKLRKLALCRLGDPRYLNYRQRYFDGKNPK